MPARSCSEAVMTSSYRATGTASVRQSPAAVIETATAWTLGELPFPGKVTSFVDNANGAQEDPAIYAAEQAAERAALIDAHYARGLVDGERRAVAAAEARIQE